MKSALVAFLFLAGSLAQANDLCAVRYEGDFARAEVVKSALQLKGYFESATPEYLIRLDDSLRKIVLNGSTHIHFERRFAQLVKLPATKIVKVKSSFEWTGIEVWDSQQGTEIRPVKPERMRAHETAALEELAEKLPSCSTLK